MDGARGMGGIAWEGWNGKDGMGGMGQGHGRDGKREGSMAYTGFLVSASLSDGSYC